MQKDLRQQLIETMFEALYFEGYNASNLNALLKKAGTSKGGLYHHFSSKKALALETIEVVIGSFISHYWAGGLEQGKNPVDAIESLLKELPGTHIMGKAVVDFKYGCPLNNLIQEMSALDEDFNTLLSSLFDAWTFKVKESFDEAVRAKVFQKDVDTLALAQFTVSSIEGCLTLSKVHRSEEHYLSCASSLIKYLRGFEL